MPIVIAALLLSAISGGGTAAVIGAGLHHAPAHHNAVSYTPPVNGPITVDCARVHCTHPHPLATGHRL